ncbi:MAG: PspA/IM30 family protein [Akkermansiaceae bacterium]|nr:PspA/IM30 family protein [Akkermansiaceae bacterium]
MFRRLANIIKGFFGLFISGLEKQNPEALLEVEKENLRRQIGEFNKGLAGHAALCERLMSQVKAESAEITELTAKTSAHLKAGNRKLAGEYALRLQKVKSSHQENVSQMEVAEKTYEELKRARDVAVTTAREKIESLKRTISETKMHKAMAELNEMAAGMVTEIGGSGDTLNRLEEALREEKEQAAGRSRVARDSIDTTELKAMEAERDALSEMALADFAAEVGIVLEGDAAAGGGGSSPTLENEKTM